MDQKQDSDSRGRDRLGKITNIAILGTLLFLLLNPSGVIGSWVSRQFADLRQQRAVGALWEELAGYSGVGGEPDANGRPVVIEFLDHQCPACRAVAPLVSRAIEDGTAHIVIRHLPLEAIHPIAREAAKAVVCAERQGRSHAAHEALMDDEDLVSRRDWLVMAGMAGVGDLSQFAECLEGEEAEQRVEGDMRMAAALGIGSTPTFVTRKGIFLGTGGFQAAMEGTNQE